MQRLKAGVRLTRKKVGGGQTRERSFFRLSFARSVIFVWRAHKISCLGQKAGNVSVPLFPPPPSESAVITAFEALGCNTVRIFEADDGRVGMVGLMGHTIKVVVDSATMAILRAFSKTSTNHEVIIQSLQLLYTMHREAVSAKEQAEIDHLLRAQSGVVTTEEVSCYNPKGTQPSDETEG
jgi:hypothetical protein